MTTARAVTNSRTGIFDVKILVIEARIPITGGLFEEAAIISKVAEFAESFKGSLADAVGGELDFKVKTVAMRKAAATPKAGP